VVRKMSFFLVPTRTGVEMQYGRANVPFPQRCCIAHGILTPARGN